jgi:molybdopterin-guanine dinucleotide biosynthesis protein A
MPRPLSSPFKGESLKPASAARTVAILLAGGGTDTLDGNHQPVVKALYPVFGKPVADYVLQALGESNIERIFVVYDAQTELTKVIMGNKKSVFLAVKPDSSLRSSVLAGLKKIAESYSRDELAAMNILFTPCDIPLVTAADFNNFLESSLKIEADIKIPCIDQAILTAAYPGKHFVSFYLSDKKGRYAPQSVWIARGSALNDKIDQHCFKTNDQGNWSVTDKDALKIIRLCESLLDRRKSRLNVFYILSFVAARLLFTKHFACCWRLSVSAFKKRYTLGQAREVLNCMTGVSFGFIENRIIELSGDVDEPEDLVSVMHHQKRPDSPRTFFKSVR